MNEEAQRRAIAEACGWDFDPLEAQEWGSRGTWCKSPDNDELWFHCHVPDYLHDLNAMHDAWSALTMPQKANFAVGLNKLTGLENNICGWIHLIGATAPQRAEAFLRTLGLWAEDGE